MQVSCMVVKRMVPSNELICRPGHIIKKTLFRDLPMPVRLLKFALSRKHPEPRMFTRHEQLKSSYDVVIIGGGGHGLAAAYYLARDHGIRNIAVLEKGLPRRR